MTGAMLLALYSFAIAIGGVGLMIMYARRAGLIDVPNHRSSHTVPTPRGGGLAVVLAVLAVWTLSSPPLPVATCVALLVALAALACVGWLDDRRSMPVSVRFPVHLACGLVVGGLIHVVAPGAAPWSALWIAWWVLWTAAAINITNFMDGIDGLIAGQGVVYGVFLYALARQTGGASPFGVILAAACAGFLVWNWAPAKIFLGDVGSGPLGMLMVVGGALALRTARADLVFVPLFPLYFDALATLVARIRRGERLTEAHRSHLYQRMANGGAGHAVVASIYAIAALVGALAALQASALPSVERVALIALYCAVVIACWAGASARFPYVHSLSRPQA